MINKTGLEESFKIVDLLLILFLCRFFGFIIAVFTLKAK